MKKLLYIGALVCALGSCGAPGPEADDILLSKGSGAFNGFSSSNQHYGGFRATANLELSSEAKYDVDLLEQFDLLPVSLRVSFSGIDAVQGLSFEIAEANMNPQLFLQNGQALRRVPYSEIRDKLEMSAKRKVEEANFTFRLLSEDQEDQGVMFFALPKDSRVEGSTLFMIGEDGFPCSVDLSLSLLSFYYSRRDNNLKSERIMNVGLQH